MVEEMKIHLQNLGPINEANINFSKITVVGGHNATGKSTLSKLVYSFLKSNSYIRQEIAQDSILEELKEITRYIRSYLRKIRMDDSKVLRKFSPVRFNKRRFKDIDDLIEEYEEMKHDLIELNIDNDEMAIYDKFIGLDRLIQIVYEDSNNLFKALFSHLIQSEFSNIPNNLYCEVINDLDKNSFSFIMNSENDEINYSIDGGIILNNVYYFDSVSILDTFDDFKFSDKKTVDHIKSLKECLVNSNSNNVFDEQINRHIIDLEADINKIINGQFVYEKGEFNFVSSKNVKSSIQNTASGIKQIGIIQLLLANRELKDNSVLIIDEPEVNLHPEWQMKFAEILVLISKKLNISIYINTHSPLFVEAIYTFSEYYDLSDKTKYHLAEKSSKEGLFDINEVEKDNLSKIYDNLGKPYLAMDVLRIEKSLE